MAEPHLKPGIQRRLEDLPTKPGVYIMKDADGEIIYIGKAKVLKNRVRSYFQGRETDHRAAMVLHKHVVDIEWIVTDNELEALILEANLIRQHRPKYNVLAKDDKHFPYLRLTLGEAFPRLEVVRRVDKDKHRYFGPYTDAKAMRQTLGLARELFRIRDCELDLRTKRLERACLSYHIRRCDGPCIDAITEGEYEPIVRQIVLLLEGRNQDLIAELRREMEIKAAALDFEGAARRRDQIASLETMRATQKMDLGEFVDIDVLALSREGRWACVTRFQIRGGAVLDRSHHIVKCPLEEDDAEVMERSILEFYPPGVQAPPPEIHLSTMPGEKDLLEEMLAELAGRKVRLQQPKQGDSFKTIRMAIANARMLLVEHLAKLETRNRVSHAVAALQESLGLPEPPRRIVGFDISHLQGTGTVASMVCFLDGRPHKAGYRRFHVKTVEGIDDFASMREVVGRHFRRVREEQADPPDLVLIDGGKGQLGMAVEAIRAEGFPEQQLLGLAKRIEEVFLPGRSEPILLSFHSPALKLLQHIRDEAHRFAITFQRTQRTQTIASSWLDTIPGVGPAKRSLLLQQFGSVARIRKAGEAELADVVGARLATAIREAIEKDGQEGEPGMLMAAEPEG
ncbi:MAG TPA: excinuclease ABC subunit UvrC [Fibrobacteria bacterium]|mgnify:CR=1 FL=1|nr:excinuclease ABC subunit UvrC [Fibrobacteria bacterium]